MSELIKCRSCKREIPESARRCPECNVWAPKPHPALAVLVVGCATLVVVLAIFLDLAPSGKTAKTTASTSAPAYTHLKGSQLACMSKDLFNQFVTAVGAKNGRAEDYLMQHGCMMTRPNLRVSVVDSSLLGGWIEVRAYLKNGAPVDLWVDYSGVVVGTAD